MATDRHSGFTFFSFAQPSSLVPLYRCSDFPRRFLYMDFADQSQEIIKVREGILFAKGA